MKFETEYKNIIFKFTLEKENFTDVSFSMNDKFNRLANQTIIEVKKGNLWLIPIDAEKPLDGRTIKAKKARSKNEQKNDV